MFVPKVKYIVTAEIPKTPQLKKPLSNAFDVVEIAGAKFTALELQLMEHVRQCTKEDGFEMKHIINKNGELIDGLVATSTKTSVGVNVRDGIILGHNFGSIGKFIKTRLLAFDYQGTSIHSHPCKAPLSGDDIQIMIKRGLRKQIATTPDNGFSYLERKYPKMPFSRRKSLKEAKKIGLAQIQKAKELGLNFENPILLETSNKEGLNKYCQFVIPLLEKFAKDFGFEFKHNLT